MSENPTLFSRLAAGEDISHDELLPLVYQELHGIASSYMRGERSSHTLQPTSLVHEAYLKLVGEHESVQWKSRAYFFAAAASSMRRILIDYARKRKSLRRGGDRLRIEMQDVAADVPDADHGSKLLALDQALVQLQQQDEQLARLVELRTYGGLGHEGVAEVMGFSIYEARQKWQFARAWLKVAIENSDDPGLSVDQ